MSYNTEEIRQAYKSKHNLNQNLVILSMITDDKK